MPFSELSLRSLLIGEGKNIQRRSYKRENIVNSESSEGIVPLSSLSLRYLLAGEKTLLCVHTKIGDLINLTKTKGLCHSASYH